MVNKKILFSILLLGMLVAPVLVLGQDPNAFENTANGGDTATKIATNIQALMVTLGGAIVVIGWVIAGILYLMAAGDPGKVKTAKQAMIAAIIGTVLIVIAAGSYKVIEGIVKSALEQGT
ncbi:MAG: hypothetical protein WC711_02665 [Candidatus Staskawiczbacteria bacterium]|jgi:hypothetical protein